MREATIGTVSQADDPEAARIEELLAAVARGEASDADREELALYTASNPDLPARIRDSARTGELGEGWLARVEGDNRVQLTEQSTVTRVERGAGLALVLGGMGLSLLAPGVGAVGIVAGFGVLLYSFARVRLKTHRDDPYKDVNR